MDAAYARCGPADGWRCCFNIPGVFARQRIAYRSDTLATAGAAVEYLVEAVAAAKPDCSRLALRCDSGFPYAGKKFQKAASILGISPRFARTRTPGQGGHIEAFHGTPCAGTSGLAILPSASRPGPP